MHRSGNLKHVSKTIATRIQMKQAVNFAFRIGNNSDIIVTGANDILLCTLCNGDKLDSLAWLWYVQATV